MASATDAEGLSAETALLIASGSATTFALFQGRMPDPDMTPPSGIRSRTGRGRTWGPPSYRRPASVYNPAEASRQDAPRFRDEGYSATSHGEHIRLGGRGVFRKAD